MDNKNEKEQERRCILRHVRFTPEENLLIQELADNAGMSVNSYIRRMAVFGNVGTMDWDSLREHTEAINAIGEEVRWYTSNQNPNRWLFAADIEMLMDCIERLNKSEQQLIEEIRKVS